MATAEKTAKKPSAAKTNSKRTITVQLKKGLMGCNPLQRATLKGLGLKNHSQLKTLENTSSVRGMIKKVIHLVEVVAETR